MGSKCTIGVGTEGYALLPQQANGVVVRTRKSEYWWKTANSKLQQKQADDISGPKDNEGLSSIYSEIDRLEKTKIETSTYARYAEEFYPFAIAAAILLLIEAWLRYRVLRKFP